VSKQGSGFASWCFPPRRCPIARPLAHRPYNRRRRRRAGRLHSGAPSTRNSNHLQAAHLALAIVRNTTFTWLGKNRPNALVVTDDDEMFERAVLGRVESHDATPEAELIAKADAGQLHRAIAALPLAYREALVLREIEGLSYQETSSVMSIPIGTAMSRLARARHQLIQRIGMTGKGKAGAI
jgi:RNA polymerase sigma factor (sigma-70 family)